METAIVLVFVVHPKLTSAKDRFWHLKTFCDCSDPNRHRPELLVKLVTQMTLFVLQSIALDVELFFYYR